MSENKDKDTAQRDQFAALAMQGILSKDGLGLLGSAGIAKSAYEMADQMLKARAAK